MRRPEGFFSPGLKDVIADETSISLLTKEGLLIYRGYSIRDLVEKSTYEEVTYLLLYGDLPTKRELAAFNDALRAQRQLPQDLIDIYRRVPKDMDPMDALRLGVTYLAAEDKDQMNTDPKVVAEKAVGLIARFPTIIAAFNRLTRGLEPVEPDPELNHAANFLYMMRGERPEDYEAEMFDDALILYAEHEFNASAFAARVTASTLSDYYSAIASAVATLKGPLHGGAMVGVIRTLTQFNSVAEVEPWAKAALERKERVMGFGHRVYKVKDARTELMKRLAVEMSRRKGASSHLLEVAEKLEEVMMREKGLIPNVDYYSSIFYYSLGLPVEILIPLFAMSRVAGWSAHLIEQYTNNRLIRPRGLYVGPKSLTYIPIDQRGA